MLENITDADLQAILAGDVDNEYAQRYPFYPLNSPGLPLPGPNFAAHALALCGEEKEDENAAALELTLHKCYLRALYDPTFYLPFTSQGDVVIVPVILGHLWGDDATGPKMVADDLLAGRPRVMIVGKMPGSEEMGQRRNLCGPSGQLLHETLVKLGIDEDELALWYVTNIVRWQNLGGKSSALPQAWIKDCLPLLHQEFRLVRPDIVLCLGEEATKTVCGPGHGIRNMIGRFIEKKEPINDPSEPAEYHTMKVMAVDHPAAVLRATEIYPRFESTLRKFVDLVRGRDFTKTQNDIKITVVYKEHELKKIVDYIIAKPGLKKIAVDAEWHGMHPGEPGSYLRTIQISYTPNIAIVIALRKQGGEAVFHPTIQRAINQLQRLLDRDDVQIGGSFFNADLPWLEYNGLHIAHRFTVPDTVEEIRGGDYAGGMDVALAHHAYNETGDFKLEIMGVNYCGADRWDVDLLKWKKEYLSQHKMKDAELEGYGECPDEILIPYAGKDAAYTRKLMDVHAQLLNRDRWGNDCWRPFHISMLAFPAFNEMGMTGVKVDSDRIDELTDLFMEAHAEKLQKLREDIKWPTFNPRSSQQCVEFLFGTRYSTKRDKRTGERLSVRPAGALSLELEPIKATDGRSWQQVMQSGDVDKASPSTDKEVCGILGLRNSYALALRDIRIIDQVLKSVFRPPEMDGNKYRLDRDGRRVYAGGIAKYICFDQRVRSSFQQVLETGRASSARPPLQNISKRREDDYKRILGSRYRWPIRSFIVSNIEPKYDEPTVLLEADYRSAELFGMAVMSRDAQMLEHCQRAALDDDDPNFYDIHSNIAVMAFKLDCEPTKKGLMQIGQQGKRVAAKNIIFGIGYGRTAEACARQCKEEGTDITEAEAQQIIDTIFEMYPNLTHLQHQLRARVETVGWIRNCFGRYRRFITSSNTTTMAEMRRQALNFPFQSMVADAVSLALHQLWKHPDKLELGYKIILQIHDAIVLEVPTRSIDIVHDKIMPECMCDKISFRSCDLDGIPYPDSPEYHFSIDRQVSTRWGVALTWDDCDALGISRRYGYDGGTTTL